MRASFSILILSTFMNIMGDCKNKEILAVEKLMYQNKLKMVLSLADGKINKSKNWKLQKRNPQKLF